MPTPVLAAHTYAPQSLAQAAAMLAEGKLVVLPTETVYGIGLSLAAPGARDRVKQLKAITGPPHWVIHLGTPDAVQRYLPHLSNRARRLLARAWPGPVAFEFALDRAQQDAAREILGAAAAECLVDGNLTLRCPDHAATREILAAAGVPITILAAGSRYHTPPPYEASDVPAEILAGVDAIVDGGPTRYRKPSTLVHVAGESLRVVRAGVIDERIVQRMADMLILFVCSGNTCRSPMAAAIAQQLLAQRLGVHIRELPARNVIVQSAGLHAARGMRATAEAVEALEVQGIDLRHHASQPATSDLLRRADVIYTMTAAHRAEILDLLPGAAGKTHCLDPDGDIEDPIGSSAEVYGQVAARLEQVLRFRVSELPL